MKANRREIVAAVVNDKLFILRKKGVESLPWGSGPSLEVF